MLHMLISHGLVIHCLYFVVILYVYVHVLRLAPVHVHATFDLLMADAFCGVSKYIVVTNRGRYWLDHG